jgi:hypothetical protein
MNWRQMLLLRSLRDQKAVASEGGPGSTRWGDGGGGSSFDQDNDVRIGFGNEFAPKLSDKPVRSASGLKWWGGGDRPENDQSKGATIGNLEIGVKMNSKNDFTAKVISSKYGEGWGMYSQDHYSTFDEAKTWAEDVYTRLPDDAIE